MENRRSFLAGALAALSALGLTARANAAPASSGKQKVVYHLSDLDKVNFVLGNIKNHIKGMGGPDKVDIQLVVHGPALKAFHTDKAKPGLDVTLNSLRGEGVGLTACGNTMRAQKVEITQIMEGFVRRDEGGVVVIALLEQQGYVYLRP